MAYIFLRMIPDHEIFINDISSHIFEDDSQSRDICIIYKSYQCILLVSLACQIHFTNQLLSSVMYL